MLIGSHLWRYFWPWMASAKFLIKKHWVCNPRFPLACLSQDFWVYIPPFPSTKEFHHDYDIYSLLYSKVTQKYSKKIQSINVKFGDWDVFIHF